YGRQRSPERQSAHFSFGRYLGSPSPCPIARGRAGACRPPQPGKRTRDAGEPAPRKAKAARPCPVWTDHQRQDSQIRSVSLMIKKIFGASARCPIRLIYGVRGLTQNQVAV